MWSDSFQLTSFTKLHFDYISVECVMLVPVVPQTISNTVYETDNK